MRTHAKVVLVGIGLKINSIEPVKESLSELHELVEAAGGEVVGAVTQLLSQWNPSMLMGTGKVEELKKQIQELGADMVVFDRWLSGVQERNLTEALSDPQPVKVLDRNQLILQIFGQRATTYEGKLQVELAQIMDQLPRQVGAWNGSLSRQGGGIGTLGPGESALEIDRRRLKERMTVIRRRLEVVRDERARRRNSRRRNQVPSFALIGYTNTGKSSLLNRLTGSQVLSKNQMFATLDPTTRKVYLPGGPDAVITDTVGFIRELPTQLIEAFKATLEESGEADVLLHVVDLASPYMESQMAAVDNLIKELGWSDKKVLHVFNKVDIAPPDRKFKVKSNDRVFVSAATGEGLDLLKERMSELIQSFQKEVQLFFPRAEEYRIYDLLRDTQIRRKEAASQGTLCYAFMTPGLLIRWKDFLVA